MQSGSDWGIPVSSRLALLAARQHGVVATWQLLELGYSKRGIHRAVEAGYLHRLYRGVYAVGHRRITLRGRWMAAVLACGPGAHLSHHAAAALHDLRGAPWQPIDVTAPTRHAIDGIRCHIVRHLDPADITLLDAIPVATVSRLMLDLAETLPGTQRLRSLLEAAQRAGAFDLNAINAVTARNPGRHGLKPLTDALSELQDEPPWTQSELETRFLELIRAHRLPEPQTNVMVAGVLVDCVWRSHNLCVEVDGWSSHRAKRSFEEDHLRDTELVKNGWRVVRFSHDRVWHQPAAVVRDLETLLSRERPAHAEPPQARSDR
jgi:very-short-patch-repair endonuclease